MQVNWIQEICYAKYHQKQNPKLWQVLKLADSDVEVVE